MKIVLAIMGGLYVGFHLACIVIGILMDEPHNPD